MTWAYINPFSNSFHEGSLFIALFMLVIVVYPVAYWLWTGWAWKQNDIFVSLTAEAKNEYLFAFQRQDRDIKTSDERFKTFYNRWYGRANYFVPVTCLIFVSFFLSFSLADTALYYTHLEQGDSSQNDYSHIPIIAASAFAGAYIFVASDMIFRAARRDVTTDDVLSNALRLTGSIPLGYAFSQLAAQALGPFIAFAVGAFPLSVLAIVLKRIANKKLELDIGSDSAPDQVVKLSGIDASTSDRISECDITTIAQLAYCDPIQLAMRSNLGFSYIIDIVSQALARVYLDDKLDLMRSSGLRGAFEIYSLYQKYRSSDPIVQKKSAEMIEAIAKKIDVDPSSLANAMYEIAEDPRTIFLIKSYS